MRKVGLVIAGIGMLLACLLTTASASAYSTGQFTRATATPDWSHGSFSGQASWVDCNAGCKSYLILIFDEPSVYTCSAEDWLIGGDPNIRQVWNSGGQTSNKAITFEVTSTSLIPGVYGQRLCMIGVQSTETEFGTYVGQQLLTSSLFQVETIAAPPPPSTAPPAAPPATPPAANTPKHRMRCPKGKRRMRRHGRVLCIKKRHRQ